MDWIRKNSETLGFAAGTAAVATGIYLLFKRQTENHVKMIQEEPSRHLTHTDKNKLIGEVKVEYDGDYLTTPTIHQIHETIMQYSLPEYIELLERYRRERRANKDNIRLYVDLWKTFTQNVNEIFIRNSRNVLKALIIPESVWENSHVNHAISGNENMMLNKARLPQLIKDKLKPKKTVTKPEFLKILRTQLEFVKEEARNPTEIARYTVDPVHTVAVIQTRVDDRTFEVFRVEEEDLSWAKLEFKNEIEVLDADSQLQLAYIQLVQP
jgi:hypothetical protein